MKTMNISVMHKSRKEPEYMMIVDVLKSRLKTGEIKPGDFIRSEYFFSVEFNVSKLAVKNAFTILMNEGYLYSIPGKGYFACKKEFDAYTLSFDEMMTSKEMSDEIRIISVNIIDPVFEISNNIALPKSRKIIVIKRVFLYEKSIKAYEIKFLPYLKGIPIIESELVYLSFPEIVIEKKATSITTKKLKIKAQQANGEISQILKVREGEPVLVVEQKYFNASDKPIGWGLLYFPQDDSGLNATTSFF